jgi:single-strand DNA-binding protein
MLNHITLQGRLVRDPELRRTGTGLAVASFCVACERDFPNKDTGEKEVDFIDCVAWRQTGEFVSKYFNKGAMIILSGRLQLRKWVDKDGNKRTTAEIVVDNVYFGGSKKDQENTWAPADPYTGVPYYNPNQYAATSGYSAATPFNANGVKVAVSDFALLDDDDAQLPF